MDWTSRKQHIVEFCALSALKGQAASLAGLQACTTLKFNAGCLSAIMIIVPCPLHVKRASRKKYLFSDPPRGVRRPVMPGGFDSQPIGFPRLPGLSS